jgi:NAD(P)-dependent dehydrogenase (short-subunit alcohol dehydrogenase family)
MRASNGTDPRDRFDLTGRVALVTGATRGLGRAIVYALARAGADVIVSSRKHDACEEVAQEVRDLGRQAMAHACHVASWDQINGLVEAAYRRFGHVDVLVNNAGISPVYPTPEGVTEELWDKVLGVNLKGPFRLSALVGARMRDRGGSIVNISSIGAVRPSHDIIPYATAKAGMNAMTVGFADALGPNVRVNTGTTRRSPPGRARIHCAGPASPTRSSARCSTSPATRRASRPAPYSRSTAARSGALPAAAKR